MGIVTHFFLSGVRSLLKTSQLEVSSHTLLILIKRKGKAVVVVAVAGSVCGKGRDGRAHVFPLPKDTHIDFKD